MAGDRAVGADLDAPAPVGARAGGLREDLGQAGGVYARRPDHGSGGDALLALTGLDRQPARIDCGRHGHARGP